MTTLQEQDQKAIDDYVQHCRDNWHSVSGIAEAYCRADFKAGMLHERKRQSERVSELVEAAKAVACGVKESRLLGFGKHITVKEEYRVTPETEHLKMIIQQFESEGLL
jgi:hypothetical protein